MNKVLCLLFIMLSMVPTKAQNVSNIAKGLGFELGVGSNELLWGVKDDVGDRSEFLLSISARIFYKISLSESLKLKPFFGYLRHGGLSEEQDNGYKDEFYFDSFELGNLFVLQQHDLPLQFSLGFKIKRHINAKLRSFGEFEAQDNSNAKWLEQDASNIFEKLSYNLGAGIGTNFESINFTIEYWVGLNDFKNESFFNNDDSKIKENHYRLFIGYQL